MHGLVIDIVSIVVAGTMTGTEFTVAVFLHPTIGRLPDGVHTAAAKAFAKLFGRVMPFWYASTLILSVIEVWRHWPIVTAASEMLLAASILWLLTIIFSLTFPVPVNNRIAAWNLTALPANWREDRKRWDRLHAVRVCILVVALTNLVAGILTA